MDKISEKLVKTGENLEFGQNFRKISISFETSRFRSKYPKISILVKIFAKSWLMPKFSKYHDFGQNCGQNFDKSSFRSKFSKKSRFGSIFLNISNDTKLSKNPDFGHNFRNITILIEIFKSLVLVKIFKYLDFGQNFRKYQFWTKFSKKSDFGQNWRKFQVW